MKQTAITISMINQQGMNRTEGQTLRAVDGEQRMTSMEIAELTGKQHKHVMEAIRRMEPAWEKVQGTKFRLSQRNYELPTGGMKAVPCYSLTKTECLYVATKFNDEARARLVLRWQQLEKDRREALEWERWKARWSLNYDLWCKMQFFGDAIRQANNGDERIGRRGPRNLLELLPDTFTIEDAARVRQQQGLDSKKTRNMISAWKNRQYILQMTDDSFQKLRFKSGE